VPSALARLTVTATFNDLDSVERLLRADNVAAIIVEPVIGNAGFIPPDPRFLPGLRTLADQYGSLLVFDEVMTGFRIARGGARERFGVIPDLTTLGKVIGGGLPVAAYGGRRELMESVAPAGSVYQAGTLSGNPLAMAAGVATLTALTADVHGEIAQRTASLVRGLRESAARHSVPLVADCAGSMWGFFFRAEPVRSFADAKTANVDRFRRFFHHVLEAGVYIAPSAFEAAFMSAAHSDSDIDATLERFDRAMRDVA
jgi:glutamate-1-semialdehyde 2,1-aminomutase